LCYSVSSMLFSDDVFSQVIRSALVYSFPLVAQVHSTYLHGVWRPLNLHNFHQSSTNVHLHHLGHQLQSPPEALYQVASTRLKAMTHSPEVTEVVHHRRHQRKMMHSPSFLIQAGWVLVQRIHILSCTLTDCLIVILCWYWIHIDNMFWCIGWAKKVDVFQKLVTPVHDDIERHFVYQNVYFFIVSESGIRKFKYFWHKFREITVN